MDKYTAEFESVPGRWVPIGKFDIDDYAVDFITHRSGNNPRGRYRVRDGETIIAKTPIGV